MRVAILASGRGSNLQSLINHFGPSVPSSPIDIVGVLCNVPEAMALKRAEKAGIPAFLIDHRSYKHKVDFEAAMERQLKIWQTEWIALAGFMRLLSPDFVRRWHNRLVNIHPSLLPEFRGLDTHKRALQAGSKRHGCTVHLVRTEVDTGPILGQAALDIEVGDTEETLAARILELEHQLYPEVLLRLAQGRIKLPD